MLLFVTLLILSSSMKTTARTMVIMMSCCWSSRLGMVSATRTFGTTRFLTSPLRRHNRMTTFQRPQDNRSFIKTAFVSPFSTAKHVKDHNNLKTNHCVGKPLHYPQLQQKHLMSTKNAQEVTASNDVQQQEEEDTIFAVSSGASVSSSQATAVAVIRITGPQSHTILQTLMTPQQSLPPTRKACVRTLYDPKDNSPLDQALVLTFSKPYSFTGEDVVELHCHGSRAVLQGVLEALGRGSEEDEPPLARYAERGEFTSRAFANGKLDLLEVEALADLLTADTQTQRQQALQQLEGRLSNLYNTWRENLISGLAHAEAVIDFGDDEHLDDFGMEDDEEHFNYDAAQMNVWGNVGANMANLCQQMESHLQDSNRGELVREGLKIAIVGPPNAGKSSLFNMLARREAAIVSPIAGTTRDVLELTLDLGGVRCTLSDTAGVREDDSTQDIIEMEGIKRARNVASQANIVVAMMDATDVECGQAVLTDVLEHSLAASSSSIDDDDRDQQQPLEAKDVLVVMNKMDLLAAATQANDEVTSSESLHKIGGTYEISCETSDGVDIFLDALTEKVLAKVSSPTDDDNSSNASEGAIITRARHRQHVKDAVEALRRFDTLSKQGYMALDMAAEELRLAVSELGRITGAVDVEDVLDVLFTDFCIGK